MHSVGPERRGALDNYIRDCTALKRDLDNARADIEFVSRQQGSLRYAIDFSEIFAYALPEDTADELMLFSEDYVSPAKSLQRLALRRLFYGTPESLILLKPYTTEFASFLQF